MSGSSVYFSGDWKSQPFTSNGSFIVPEKVSLVFIEMYGGGGAGAQGGLSGSPVTWVFGGEAGNFVSKPVLVTPGASLPVVIGPGGASTGLAGGDTSFAGLYFARGGRGGVSQDTIGSNLAMTIYALNGYGQGRDSIRALGGNNTAIIDDIGYGGDAGYGAGGNASTTVGSTGGIGAGGGAAVGTGSTAGGPGGPGIVIIYYKKD
jgi:hypothetical protein